MNVLFDHQTFSQQEFGGISRYFCELITGINQTRTSDAYLSLLFSNNAHLREAGLKSYSFLPFANFSKKADFLYKVNQLNSILDLRRSRYDLFHTTNYDPYFIPYLKGKPFVVTFYDLIHEKFTGQYKELSHVEQLIGHKKMLADRAAAIIAISESTKKDLVKIHSINPDKIHVVHLGSSFGQSLNQEVSAANTAPYLLYVGKRNAYKNFTPFLIAVSELLKHYDITLVCAGGGGFTAEEQLFIRSLALEQLVTYTSVDDQILQRLYGAARGFIFPSLYEGFGIPVLEAFACNCPCVLSNTSSLPEVAGDAALYFNPTNESSIAQAVEQIIINGDLRNSLIDKGHQRLSLFSWEQTVAQTLAVYQACL